MSGNALPHDIIFHILSFLPGETLVKFLLVSKFFQKTSRTGVLWKELRKREPQKFLPSGFCSSDYFSFKLAKQNSILEKKEYLKSRISIRNSIRASSRDYSSQDIENSLKRNLWSSTGTFDPNSTEYLLYNLLYKHSLITRISIEVSTRPEPYCPREIIFSIGTSQYHFHYHSQVYDVQWTRKRQTFLMSPMLAIGSVLKVNLFGRRCAEGASYLTNLYYIKVDGIPLDLRLSPDEETLLQKLISESNMDLQLMITDALLDPQKEVDLSSKIHELLQKKKSENENSPPIQLKERWLTYAHKPDSEDSAPTAQFQGDLTRFFPILVQQKIFFAVPEEIHLIQSSHLVHTIQNLQMLHLSVTDDPNLEIPLALFSLTNLRILNLSDNQLKVLPKEIGNLVNLRRLDLVGNCFSEIPKEIGNLKFLKELFLGDGELHHRRRVTHQFKTLPDEMARLTSLETLWVQECGLTEFPKVLYQLKGVLKQLIISTEYFNTAVQFFGREVVSSPRYQFF